MIITITNPGDGTYEKLVHTQDEMLTLVRTIVTAKGMWHPLKFPNDRFHAAFDVPRLLAALVTDVLSQEGIWVRCRQVPAPKVRVYALEPHWVARGSVDRVTTIHAEAHSLDHLLVTRFGLSLRERPVKIARDLVMVQAQVQVVETWETAFPVKAQAPCPCGLCVAWHEVHRA